MGKNQMDLCVDSEGVGGWDAEREKKSEGANR